MWRSRSGFSPLRPRLAGAALALLLPAVAGAQETTPVITSVSPSSGSQGTLITLTGSGFNPDPEAHAVALTDGLSGVEVEVLAATSTQLLCRLGAVPESLVGDLRAAEGWRVHLPDDVVAFSDRLYRLTDISWFIGPVHTKLGPFTALPGSKGDPVTGSDPNEGDPAGSSAHVNTPPGQTKIRVPIEIVTEGPSPEEPPPESGGRLAKGQRSGVDTMISARITVLPVLAIPGTLTPQQLAADLAVILQHTFGSLGLTASASGDVLSLGYRYGATSSYFVLDATGG